VMLIATDTDEATDTAERPPRPRRLARVLGEPWPPVAVARLCGLAVTAIALAALVWAFALEGAPAPAPEYALGSSVLWRGERAAEATLLAAALVTLPAQLLAGRLPRSIGRDGVDWGEAGEGGAGRGAS
jgi:hypothetical protein